jgi:SAM-dependent methyltransferase
MFKQLIARIAAIPRVYDLIQAAAGDDVVQERVARYLRALPAQSRLVELGGGTGLAARSARDDTMYVCVDLDPDKLQRFVRQHRGARALVGDATQCPIRTGAADAVMAVKVTHHLDDTQLAAMVSEAARIVRPGGTLIVVDAVRADRVASRLLWELDRGAYPRRAEAIRAAVTSRFTPIHVEEFSARFLHRFLLCVGSRGASA